jgi:hypothetical protein
MRRGQRQERGRRELRQAGDGGAVVAVCRLVVAVQARQPAEHAVDRQRRADRDRQPAGVGGEDGAECGGLPRGPDTGRHVAQQRHQRQAPVAGQQVGGERRAVLDHAANLVGITPRPGGRRGRDANERWRRLEPLVHPVDELVLPRIGHPPDLANPRADRQLQPDRLVLVTHLATELPQLRRHVERGRPVAVAKAQHRPARQRLVPPLGRGHHDRGDVEGGERPLGAGPVRPLEGVLELPLPPGERQVGPAEPVAEGDDLLGDRAAVRRSVDAERDEVAVREGGHEPLRVAEPARHDQGGVAVVMARGHEVRPRRVQDRQPAQHVDPDGVVARGQRRLAREQATDAGRVEHERVDEPGGGGLAGGGQLGVVAVPGQLGGLLQGRTGGGPGAGRPQGLAMGQREARQEVARHPTGRPQSVERGTGHLGRTARVAGARQVAGQAERVPPGGGRVAQRQRGQAVGHHGRPGGPVTPVASLAVTLPGVRQRDVQLAPAGGRCQRRGRRPIERMAEAGTLARPPDDPGRRRPVQMLGDRHRLGAESRGTHLDADQRARQGEDGQRLLCGRLQPSQVPGEDVPDRVRQLTAVAQRDQLADEQRVAPGSGGEPGGIDGARRGQGPHELGDRVGGEAAHDDDVALAPQARQRLGAGLVGSSRPQQAHGRPGEPAGHALDRPARGVVRPVQVVEDHQDRCGLPQHVHEGVDDLPPPVRGRQRRVGGGVAADGPHDVIAQPERRPLGLFGLDPHDAHAPRGGLGGELLGEARLAHPRLALDQRDHRLAGERAVELPPQDEHLALPADEVGRRHRPI